MIEPSCVAETRGVVRFGANESSYVAVRRIFERFDGNVWFGIIRNKPKVPKEIGQFEINRSVRYKSNSLRKVEWLEINRTNRYKLNNWK